jgi:hypothetical protein
MEEYDSAPNLPSFTNSHMFIEIERVPLTECIKSLDNIPCLFPKSPFIEAVFSKAVHLLLRPFESMA